MEDRPQVPHQETIIEERDKQTGAVLTRYAKGKLLGKGGFAKCYELTNLTNNHKYAVKIVEKASLTRSKAREKLTSEIRIHKSVKSHFVVRYEHFFEDKLNVYIILELCPNQTLNELVKRRKRITELETKYYMRQIALAVKDFQNQMIIHRDLKLGNLLLTDCLEIRISDFGLAAKLTDHSERRKTMCGTPNYIAPEILENHNHNGHSYEVDIWSMGVIAYAFLVGRPPFETNDVKATYSKIKQCNYSFPDTITISQTAQNFIAKMLQKDPQHRSTIDEILNDEFLAGAIPQTLPTTCLACPPNANFIRQFQPSLIDSSEDYFRRSSREGFSEHTLLKDALKTERGTLIDKFDTTRTLVRTNSIEQVNKNTHLHRAASTAALAGLRGRTLHKTQTPALVNTTGPHVWVIYYEENPKFGISYLLNSVSTGMKYNDSTCLISNCTFTKLKYIDNGNKLDPEVYTLEDIPENLTKKLKIITHYQKELKSKKETEESSMANEQLIQRERNKFRETNETALCIYVIKHRKTSKANLFWFNTKDYQIIFKDYTELLFSRDNITYVNKVGERKYFTKEGLEAQSEEIKKRVKYTLTIVQSVREESNTRTREISKNKENVAEEGQSMARSSSLYKLERNCKPVMLKGCASMNRLINVNHPKLLKY